MLGRSYVMHHNKLAQIAGANLKNPSLGMLIGGATPPIVVLGISGLQEYGETRLAENPRPMGWDSFSERFGNNAFGIVAIHDGSWSSL